jgi:hypothetical protein
MGAMKTRKPKSEPNLRDRLSANFLTAFESDFAANGVAVIEKLRERHPDKYAEIATKLIVAAEPPKSLGDFSDCKTMEDVSKQLLQQVGVSEAEISEWMVQEATEANRVLVERLEQIAALGASAQTLRSGRTNWAHDPQDEGLQ